jgi:hypothetical protein
MNGAPYSEIFLFLQYSLEKRVCVLPGCRLCTVEVQGSTASLYAEAESGGRARFAFLIKRSDSGGLSLEGRSGDRELLAGLLEEMANQLA